LELGIDRVGEDILAEDVRVSEGGGGRECVRVASVVGVSEIESCESVDDGATKLSDTIPEPLTVVVGV
jgi:hypothetical protein